MPRPKVLRENRVLNINTCQDMLEWLYIVSFENVLEPQKVTGLVPTCVSELTVDFLTSFFGALDQNHVNCMKHHYPDMNQAPYVCSLQVGDSADFYHYGRFYDQCD